MTQPTRYSQPPVVLGIPDPDPEPVDGCDVCGALARERAEARAGRNGSQAADCSVEIRRHPHRQRERAL